MTTTTGEERGIDPAAQGRGKIPQDSFEARLILVRLHAGNLTIEKAAARCGLLNQNWSNWERGIKPRDKEDTVRRISEGLGIDREWLMWGGPLAPEQRGHRGKRVRLPYPARAGVGRQPITRERHSISPPRPPTFGQRSSARGQNPDGRKINTRPPGHPMTALRRAA
jgi:transcriptional regulator with XRE-family HTH domain